MKRERENLCLFGENGFDELESDILFLDFTFGFVNCLGHLIIE